jgi:hypothetical protein
MSAMGAVVDDLLEVRTVLERGWCKGALEDGKGRYCLLGAIGLVTTGSAYEWNARSVDVYEVVWPLLPSKYHRMDDFNNAPATTHADVLGLVDEALEALAVAA